VCVELGKMSHPMGFSCLGFSTGFIADDLLLTISIHLFAISGVLLAIICIGFTSAFM
jgi:hypothetical protein